MARPLGVDVSEWNGTINWAQFKQQGVKFALIRAGHGSHISQIDPEVKRNIKEAYKQGIAIGIYWFGYSHTVANARVEADVCNAIIKPFKKYITLPVFFDWEYHSYDYVTGKYTGIKLCTPTKKLVTDMTIAFMDRMQEHGYKSGYYTNIDYLNRFYDYNRIKNYNLWIAQWGVSAPDSRYKCVIHQYSATGKLRGNGSDNVDLNYMYSDKFSVGTGGGIDIENFQPRLSKDDSFWGKMDDPKSNAYQYYHGSKCFDPTSSWDGGVGLPNCTAYAWGRFREIGEKYTGVLPVSVIRGDAGAWYDDAESRGIYEVGQTPRVGAIMCWQVTKGSSSGHVAIVEAINGDTLTLSESGYLGDYFRKGVATKNGNSWYSPYVGSYYFRGFIYLDNFDAYGNYIHREWVAKDEYLTEDEIENNAILVTRYLLDKGWAFNTIMAMMGNMMGESGINPGNKQDGYPAWGSDTGYGLCQWTPYAQLVCSDYAFDILGKDPEDRLKILQDGDLQCGFLEWERQLSIKGKYSFYQGYDFKNNGSISTGLVYYWWEGHFEPPKELLFHEFATNSKDFSLKDLVRCFLRYYEHGKYEDDSVVNLRYKYAKDLYDKLINNPEIYTVTPPNIYSCDQVNAKTLVVSGYSGGKVDLTKSVKLYYNWGTTEIDIEKKDTYVEALDLGIDKSFSLTIRKRRLAKNITFKLVQSNGGDYQDQIVMMTVDLTPSYPCVQINIGEGKFVPFVPFIKDENGVNMYVPVIKLEDGYYAIYNTDIEKIS